jgi:hypothetical protein
LIDSQNKKPGVLGSRTARKEQMVQVSAVWLGWSVDSGPGPHSPIAYNISLQRCLNSAACGLRADAVQLACVLL